MTHPIWPLFDLEVVTSTLTLRYVDDDLATELADVAAKGVHDPAATPFLFAWTDVDPPEQQRNTLRHHWELRSRTTPAAWSLALAVIVDGQAIGTTNLDAKDFPLLRTVTTGSWLGIESQRRGYGKELRRATLALAFDGLGTEVATTAAWHDNGGSLGVTRSLGYEPVARTFERRRERRDEMLTFTIDRSGFDRLTTDDIELRGCERARDFLEID